MVHARWKIVNTVTKTVIFNYRSNMTACGFSYSLLSLLRRTLGGGKVSCHTHKAVRDFSCSTACSQLHRPEGSTALMGKVDRFGGVTVNLADSSLPEDISESSFSGLLHGVFAYFDETKLYDVPHKLLTFPYWLQKQDSQCACPCYLTLTLKL